MSGVLSFTSVGLHRLEIVWLLGVVQVQLLEFERLEGCFWFHGTSPGFDSVQTVVVDFGGCGWYSRNCTRF